MYFTPSKIITALYTCIHITTRLHGELAVEKNWFQHIAATRRRQYNSVIKGTRSCNKKDPGLAIAGLMAIAADLVICILQWPKRMACTIHSSPGWTPIRLRGKVTCMYHIQRFVTQALCAASTMHTGITDFTACQDMILNMHNL